MTDEQALDRYATHRDAEAFRTLVERYQRLVYAAAGRRLGRSQDIEDVTQQTFLKLSQAAGTIRDSLGAWLYTTAIHAATDLIRRDATRRRHEALAVKTETESPLAEGLAWHELSLIVDEANMDLPEEERTLIVEHFLRGRSQRELAGERGVSQPTAMRRIDKAVEMLRENLAKRGCSAAPAAVTACMLQQALPEVPASLTGELAKIGLAAPRAAVKPAITFAAAMGAGKAAIAAGVAAVLLAGAGAAWWMGHRPPNPGPAAGASPAVTATAPASDSSDKRTALERLGKVYALADGENLRKVAPPFPPERIDFANTVYAYAKGSENIRTLPFSWENGRLVSRGISYIDSSLEQLLTHQAVGLEWYQLDHLDRIHWHVGSSDWIIRQGLSLPDRLEALAKIISVETGKPVHFEHKLVRRPCIVLQEEPKKGPDNGHSFATVVITLRALDNAELKQWIAGQRPKESTNAFQFQEAAKCLDAPLFLRNSDLMGFDSDALYYIGADANLRHTDPDFRQKLRQVLDNIKAQIGGVWQIEDREIDVWEPAMPAH